MDRVLWRPFSTSNPADHCTQFVGGKAIARRHYRLSGKYRSPLRTKYSLCYREEVVRSQLSVVRCREPGLRGKAGAGAGPHVIEPRQPCDGVKLTTDN
jgi:hypothetical protein